MFQFNPGSLFVGSMVTVALLAGSPASANECIRGITSLGGVKRAVPVDVPRARRFNTSYFFKSYSFIFEPGRGAPRRDGENVQRVENTPGEVSLAVLAAAGHPLISDEQRRRISQAIQCFLLDGSNEAYFISVNGQEESADVLRLVDQRTGEGFAFKTEVVLD